MAEFKEKEGKDSDSRIREIDKELEEILAKRKANIRVVGCGGGGGNTLSRMKEIGNQGR